jgi:hypothetical protein
MGFLIELPELEGRVQLIGEEMEEAAIFVSQDKT